MDNVAFESLLELPRLRVGAAGPVMLTYFDGLGEMPAVTRAQQTALTLARRRGRALGSIVIVGDGKTTVNTGDNDARSEFLRVLREVDKHIAATAVVVASRGFGGAALRAFISGIFLAARTPYPMRVFDSYAAARDWLLSQPLFAPERASLARAVDEGLAKFEQSLAGA